MTGREKLLAGVTVSSVLAAIVAVLKCLGIL